MVGNLKLISMKNIESALEIFLESAIKEVEATEIGDFKTVNKCYKKITESMNYLKSKNEIYNLKDYLHNPSVGIRLWVACYWLNINEKEGLRVIENIVKSKDSGIYSLTAETTLSEWKKGNLKF